MSPSSLRTFPSFGALLRAAWDLFRARFWKFAALVLAFNLGMLAVQVSAFGAAAWQSFLDYLDRGGSASLGIIPSVGAASGVSLLVVVPVALVSLFLQLWFLASLVALVEYREGAPSFRALLREGWRAFPRTLVAATALFLSVRIFYFLMVFLTSLVHRYIGMTDGVLATTNRIFLLVFAVVLLIGALIAGLALLPAEAPRARNPFLNLRDAFRRFWNSPWEISWRAGAALLLIYVLDQFAAPLARAGLPINPQALLSLFYLPFLLCVLAACLRAPADPSP